MSREEAAVRGQTHLWEGNEQADIEANRARENIGEAGFAYIAQQKRRFATIVTLPLSVAT
jgi:hypothetical protein